MTSSGSTNDPVASVFNAVVVSVDDRGKPHVQCEPARLHNGPRDAKCVRGHPPKSQRNGEHSGIRFVQLL